MPYNQGGKKFMKRKGLVALILILLLLLAICGAGFVMMN